MWEWLIKGKNGKRQIIDSDKFLSVGINITEVVKFAFPFWIENCVVLLENNPRFSVLCWHFHKIYLKLINVYLIKTGQTNFFQSQKNL